MFCFNMVTLLVYIQSLLVFCTGTVPPPHSLHLLGTGYNLLRGNPDGGIGSLAGVDPGILSTRKIFQLSSGDVPKEIIYEPTYCRNTTSTMIFYGAKSYQNYLLKDLSTSGDGNDHVTPYAFMLSTGFKDINDNIRLNHDIFRDVITTCNTGRARYSMPPSQHIIHSVTKEFAANVCNLPSTYNETIYRNFLDDWGTHIVIQVELGGKEITRYTHSVADIAKIVLAHNENVGTLYQKPYMGYGTVLELNMDHLYHTDYSLFNGGSKLVEISRGSVNNPGFISTKLVTISQAFTQDFWHNITQFVSEGICKQGDDTTLLQKKANIIIALEQYHFGKGITNKPTDIQISIPVTWPDGTYGVMKPITGCPVSPFPWLEGFLLQDGENANPHDSHTSGIHLSEMNTLPSHASDLKFRFCIKENVDQNQYRRNWPAGNYCILKKKQCPSGFDEGSIFWDDENHSNINSHNGILPDGSYGHDTLIEYCCRYDGRYDTPILMPIDKPFYLLRYTSRCQEVRGMTVTDEYVLYDEENDSPSNSCSGAHPYLDYNCKSNADHKLHFCYYHTPNNASSIYVFG